METYRLTLPGPMLRRGFWLYVWRVITQDDQEWLYVGRTGDNSSPNAAPPYIRMGQHLGSVKNQNALRHHLREKKINPESCKEFQLVAHGPIFPEVEKPTPYDRKDEALRAQLMEKHLPLRDVVGAMEMRLAHDLDAADYDVLNEVKWNHPIADEQWLPIRKIFAVDFPKLKDLR